MTLVALQILRQLHPFLGRSTARVTLRSNLYDDIHFLESTLLFMDTS